VKKIFEPASRLFYYTTFFHLVFNKNIDNAAASKILFSSSCGLSRKALFLAAFPAAITVLLKLCDA
jgi:hypothetical protein